MARPHARIAAPPRRDLLIAAALGVAFLLDAALCPYGELTHPLAVPATLLACAPLAWRRAAPMPVLGLVVLGVFACLLTLKPVDVVVLAPMLAVFTVVQVGGDRRQSIATGLGGVGFALLGVLVGGGELRDAVYNAVLMALAAVAGETVRVKLAFAEAGARREREREEEREADARRRVADERLRIAQEVHDVVAHAMVAINVQAGVAAHLVGERPEQARSALTEIKRVSGTALGDLRATLGLLRAGDEAAPVSPTLSLDGLPALAEPLRAAGIGVTVSVGAEPVPTAVGAAAYRIVQEALTNVLRHAGAAQVDVAVRREGERLVVEVRDDGRALVAAGASVPAGSGNGLRGMRERAGAIGGAVQAAPDPAGGWSVRASLPLS